MRNFPKIHYIKKKRTQMHNPFPHRSKTKMASISTTQRPSSSHKLQPLPLSSQPADDNGKSAARGAPTLAMSVTLTWPFSIPPTPEAAAARMVRNLGRFKLLYSLFVWGVLAIALIPRRKVSLLLLMVTGNFTLLYALLLRAMPDSVILHRLIDKRLVAALVGIVTAVEMILTRAGIHLAVVVVSCIPVILLHAVLVTPEREFGGFYCRIGTDGCEEGSHHDADEKLALDCV